MADPYNTPNYTEQGGARTVVGGSLDVASGGEIDIESGGALKIAGTAVTSDAAELNKLDGSGANVTAANLAALTAGTGTALHQHTLANGASDVTAVASEVNALAGAPLSGASLFTVGAEGGDVINVAIQLKKAAGTDLAVRAALMAYLSNDANGDSLATNAPSGGCAIGTDGVLIPVTPALINALMVDGNLAISAVPEKFKTTQTAAFLINGVSHIKAATDNLVFSAAHVITAAKFGVILIQINAAGTVSTKVPASPQAYNDAPTALAALPAADAGNVALGYIAIENNAGDWTANTDDMTNGSDLTTAAFTDSTETAIGAAKAFMLVSESDGDIDINVTEAGVATWYLVLVLPNGKLAASGAITFA